MGVGLIDDHEKQGVLNFLKRREAKQSCVALFEELNEKHEIKRGDVTKAKDPTYQQIVDSLDTALSQDWLTESELYSFLDRMEAAGRQHVLLFMVPKNKANEVNNALQEPRRIRNEKSLAGFWEPPESSFARLMIANDRATFVKIITKRRYYTQTKPRKEGNKEFFEREAHWERSAVVISFLKETGVLQIRVPVLENSADDNPKVLWELIKTIFSSHFSLPLLENLHLFPITDAFHPILGNEDDFVLTRERHDDTEYFGEEGRRRKKDGKLQDLRQRKGWKDDGKPRLRVDGAWLVNERHLECRMHFDKVKLDQRTTKDFARVFVPQACLDHEMDHVVRRIHEHLPQRN